MRIVHLCPSTAFGGTEAVAEMLHRSALQAGWQSSLVLPVVRGAAPPKLRWPRWAWDQRLDTDVVHAHLPSPERLGAALLAARSHPLVVTFHLLPHEEAWPRDRVTRLSSATLLRWAARRPRTRWVALSEHDRAALLPLLGGRTRVVRNAPPPPVVDAPPLNWRPGSVRLASVGRLHAQKGFDRMLRALADPRLRSLDWEWIVVGDGEERASLSALRDRLGLGQQVRFVGAAPASAVLRGADVLLSPSRYEGMPLVPLEAAEAGVAVLASPIAPHRELFAQVPQALLPEDESGWPAAIEAVLTRTDARERLREACAEILPADPRRACWTAYDSLYREVMRR
jgi:glycosyltransferase involved in cell wall biosynthesis